MRIGIVVKPDEEEDGAWDVDEGIDACRPQHQRRMAEEQSLYVKLPEDLQPLLQVHKLKRVMASNMDGAFDDGNCAKCPTELVDLIIGQRMNTISSRCGAKCVPSI